MLVHSALSRLALNGQGHTSKFMVTGRENLLKCSASIEEFLVLTVVSLLFLV